MPVIVISVKDIELLLYDPDQRMKCEQLTMSQTQRLCVFCMMRLRYLHGILLPIDGVFGTGSAVVAPVQVELHSLVAGGQAST